MSLSVEALHDVRFAPKREARVSPPVDDALVKYSVFAVSAEDDALPSDVCPVTESVDVKLPVVPVIAPRLATVE
jgi:hypothetical protein